MFKLTARGARRWARWRGALHERAYEAGATAFIDKPFEMYDLCTAARYWVHQGVDA